MTGPCLPSCHVSRRCLLKQVPFISPSMPRRFAEENGYSTLVCAVGPWHIQPHQPSCQVLFNPRFTEGAGLTYGDNIEHVWSDLRRHFFITMFMSPAARQDFLTSLVRDGGAAGFSLERTTVGMHRCCCCLYSPPPRSPVHHHPLYPGAADICLALPCTLWQLNMRFLRKEATLAKQMWAWHERALAERTVQGRLLKGMGVDVSTISNVTHPSPRTAAQHQHAAPAPSSSVVMLPKVRPGAPCWHAHVQTHVMSCIFSMPFCSLGLKALHHLHSLPVALCSGSSSTRSSWSSCMCSSSLGQAAECPSPPSRWQGRLPRWRRLCAAQSASTASCRGGRQRQRSMRQPRLSGRRSTSTACMHASANRWHSMPRMRQRWCGAAAPTAGASSYIYGQCGTRMHHCASRALWLPAVGHAVSPRGVQLPGQPSTNGWAGGRERRRSVRSLS